MKVPPDPQPEEGNRKKKLYQICLIRQSNDLFALINDDKVFSFFSLHRKYFIHEVLLRIKMSFFFSPRFRHCQMSSSLSPLVQHVPFLEGRSRLLVRPNLFGFFCCDNFLNKSELHHQGITRD